MSNKHDMRGKEEWYAGMAREYAEGLLSREQERDFNVLLGRDPRAQDALAEALALKTLAELGVDATDLDPEYCRQIRALLGRYERGRLSSSQVGDVAEHLQQCESCEDHYRDRVYARPRGASWLRVAAVSLVSMACLGTLWVMSPQARQPPIPQPSVQPAEGPQEARQESTRTAAPLLEPGLRASLIAAVEGARPGSPILTQAAEQVLEQVRIGDLLQVDDPRDQEDIRICLQVLGRARHPAARDWIFEALHHEAVGVKAEAAVWYKVVDKAWADDPRIAEAVRNAERRPPADQETQLEQPERELRE